MTTSLRARAWQDKAASAPADGVCVCGLCRCGTVRFPGDPPQLGLPIAYPDELALQVST